MEFGIQIINKKQTLTNKINNEITPQDLQKDVLKNLFNLFKDTWNSLILDKDTHKIIYILFNNEELREYNIVNIYLLENNRYQIPANAIYFINTTDESLNKLLIDLKHELYEEYNYIFLNYLNKNQINYLTNEINKQKLKGVNKIFDGYLDYFMIQGDIFSSEISDSLTNFNSDKIINSLFSFFFTIKKEPLIMGNEENKDILNIKTKLKEMFKNRDIIKKEGYMKTILIIIDRKDDLISPIKHNWSYNGLLHDILGINKGRIDYKEKNIILTKNDEFWKNNNNINFPEVATNIDKTFKELKTQFSKKESQIKEVIDIKTHFEDSIKMNDSKEYISNHMSLCLKLIEVIKKRSLDDFYRDENISINKINEKIIIDMSTKEEIDFLRFAAILICNDNLDDNLRQRIYELLKERRIDYSFINSLIKVYKKQSFNCLNEINETSYKKILSGVLGNIKQLLIENFSLPISEIVNEYLNKTVNEYNIEYENIEKIIVYQIGGGTYLENEALKVLERKIEIPIIYGSTEMLNIENYMKQIYKLSLFK